MLIVTSYVMKNNGKVHSVHSLTIHWNISEMVHCPYMKFEGMSEYIFLSCLLDLRLIIKFNKSPITTTTTALKFVKFSLLENFLNLSDIRSDRKIPYARSSNFLSDKFLFCVEYLEFLYRTFGLTRF